MLGRSAGIDLRAASNQWRRRIFGHFLRDDSPASQGGEVCRSFTVISLPDDFREVTFKAGSVVSSVCR
jgi:hypothetical protein